MVRTPNKFIPGSESCLFSQGITVVHPSFWCLIVQVPNCPVPNCPVPNCPVPNCPVSNCPVSNCPVSNCPVSNCPVSNCPFTCQTPPVSVSPARQSVDRTVRTRVFPEHTGTTPYCFPPMLVAVLEVALPWGQQSGEHCVAGGGVVLQVDKAAMSTWRELRPPPQHPHPDSSCHSISTGFY